MDVRNTYTYGGMTRYQPYAQSPGGPAASRFQTELVDTKTAGDESIRDRLSPASQKLLDDLKVGRSMTTTQWTSLCVELKDMGVITQAEFDYTRGDFHLAPLVSDGRGGVTCPTVVKDFLEGRRGNQWQGDPLAYLDEWVQALKEGRSKVDKEYWEDGEKKYKDLSPFDHQISACEKVMDIIKKLL